MVTANASKRLMQHYVDNFRQLPWRSPPGTPPPAAYRVWLSEVMLQQTTVAAVIPRFERFVARWPTVAALAAAPDSDVLSEWAGLGYYARARNLIACARRLGELGAFPQGADELRKLPGIGDYTAAAIASIAFGEQVPAVDTNVRRVIARLFGLPRPTAQEVRDRVAALIPPGRAGDFAQAMMDLGATICRARSPRCGECPLSSECAAFAAGDPEAFPERALRRTRPLKQGIAWWIERDGQVWLVRRPAKGMLGGMAALPGTDWSDEQPPSSPCRVGTVRHVFTHFALDLHVDWRVDPTDEGWWHPVDRLETAGLPTLYHRAAAMARSAAAHRLHEDFAAA